MKEKHSLIGVFIGLAFMAIHFQGFAHHGWSSYDEQNPVTIEGTIRNSSYKNPHGTILLQSKDEKALNIVLAPTSRMQDRGLTADMIKVGQKVTIIGYRKRSDYKELRAEKITVADKTVELR